MNDQNRERFEAWAISENRAYMSEWGFWWHLGQNGEALREGWEAATSARPTEHDIEEWGFHYLPTVPKEVFTEAARALLARAGGAPEARCDPALTECPRCRNDIQKCDGVFAAATIPQLTPTREQIMKQILAITAAAFLAACSSQQVAEFKSSPLEQEIVAAGTAQILIAALVDKKKITQEQANVYQSRVDAILGIIGSLHVTDGTDPALAPVDTMLLALMTELRGKE